MAQVRLYDLELNIPEQIWSPNTLKTRYALNYKVSIGCKISRVSLFIYLLCGNSEHTLRYQMGSIF